MELRDWLMALMSGGSGAAVYWLMENVAWLANLRPDRKRYAALGLSVALPVLAWLAAMALGYVPTPETWQAAVEQVFALAAGALLVGQGLHGARQLPRESE